MALTTADLTNVNIAAYNANSRYGKDFWTAPSGTGTYMRGQLTDTQNKVTALTTDVDALQKALDTEKATSLLRYQRYEQIHTNTMAAIAEVKAENEELKQMLATALAALPKA